MNFSVLLILSVVSAVFAAPPPPVQEVAKPLEKVEEKPANVPAVEPALKEGETLAEKPIEKEGEKLAEKPIEKEGEKLAEKPGDKIPPKDKDAKPMTEIPKWWKDIVGAELIKTDLLGNETFNSSNKTTFVMFYLEDCPDSQLARKEFGGAAVAMHKEKSMVEFWGVDCKLHEKECKEFKIAEYPTFLLFEAGEMKEMFKGEAKEKMLVDFLKSKLKKA